MSDGAALMAAIRESPEEDTPRLAYADWCEENGEEKWAKLIRWQIYNRTLAVKRRWDFQPAKGLSGDSRISAQLKANAGRWFGYEPKASPKFAYLQGNWVRNGTGIDLRHYEEDGRLTWLSYILRVESGFVERVYLRETQPGLSQLGRLLTNCPISCVVVEAAVGQFFIHSPSAGNGWRVGLMSHDQRAESIDRTFADRAALVAALPNWIADNIGISSVR